MQKNNSKPLIFIITTLFIVLVSCETTGLVCIRSGYPYDVEIYAFFKYNDEMYKFISVYETGSLCIVNARHRKEHSNLVGIKICNLEGETLAEYSSDYIQKIRDAYKAKRTENEKWIFTEKGLFLESLKIIKKKHLTNEEMVRYRDKEIVKYYGSDKAVHDLEEKLREKERKDDIDSEETWENQSSNQNRNTKAD